MEYPAEVQERINVLSEYTENNNLKECDIMHLYPGNIAFPDGYYDSRLFELVCYNSVTMEKRNLGNHDGIDTFGTEVIGVRIFADGSTMVKFKRPVLVVDSKCITVYEKHTQTLGRLAQEG